MVSVISAVSTRYEAWRELLAHGITSSMSRKVNRGDNPWSARCSSRKTDSRLRPCEPIRDSAVAATTLRHEIDKPIPDNDLPLLPAFFRSTTMRALLVEDDPLLSSAVQAGLERAGLVVDALSAAEPAEAVLRHTQYDLLVLDIGLPGMTGLELLSRLRHRGQQVPVLILTARDGIDDRVSGLNRGADDYLVKPFLMPELVARCQALVRRSRAAASSVIEFGPLWLDLGVREARLGNQPLLLTRREWDLLEHLALGAPNVVAKQKLADSLSAWDREITPNAIEMHVSRLRAKLGSYVMLRTVRGLGYRLEQPVPQVDRDG